MSSVLKNYLKIPIITEFVIIEGVIMVYYLIFLGVCSLISMSLVVLSIFSKSAAERLNIIDLEDLMVAFLISLLPILNIIPIFIFLKLNLKKPLHK